MIYKEFELSTDHPLIVSLNKMLAWIRTSDVLASVSGTVRHDLSEEALRRCMANEVPSHCKAARFDHHKGFDFAEIQEHSAKVYEEQTGIKDYVLKPVAKTWYPSGGGYLGWHIDEDGGRIYSTWADGESFFRFKHPMTGEIVTSYDKPNQWTFRIFTFDAESPLWHCVHATDDRISIGYRFIDQPAA